MPINQRIIKRNDPSPKCIAIMQGSEGEEYVRAKTFTDTVACFRRLSELSSFASEIFAELALLSTDINHRIGSLTERTAKLQITLPKLVVDASAFKINDDEYLHHRQMLQNPQSEHLVDHTTMPNSMENRFFSEEVKPRIQFGSLDEYLPYFAMGTKPTTIAQRYSNPEYFLNQWCAAQVQRMKLLEKEKRQQKVDKQARKKQRVADQAADDQQRKPRRRSSVNWQERYMVDGKAVHRKSLTETGTKGKRLSVLDAMPVRKAEQEEAEGEGEDEGLSEKGSPDKMPPLVKRPSQLTAASTKSPTVRYSSVYPSKSTKTFSEGRSMNEGTGQDDGSSEANSEPGTPSPQSASPPPPPPAPAALQSKAPPPPPAPGAPPAAAVVPAKAFSSLSLAANVPGAVPPPPAKAAAPPPPPAPAAASASSNATPPPPAPPVAAAAAGSSKATPPPPPPSASTAPAAATSPPPPPPAAPSAAPSASATVPAAASPKSASESESTTSSSAAATDSVQDAPAVTAPAAAAVVETEESPSPDADSDSDEEEDADTSGAPAADIPTPVFVPATSTYLDEMSKSSVPEYTSIKAAAVRPPPPPPPPPPGPPKDASGADTAKNLLKPRPPSMESNASARTSGGHHSHQRSSLRYGGARTASTDSISSQLGSFAYNFAASGGADGMGAVAMAGYGEEEEVDHFAAVNSDASSLKKPSPPPPPPPPPAVAAAAAQAAQGGGNTPPRVSFLDSIKQGAGSTLRKVEEPTAERRSTGPRESLLDAIKLGGGKLRKVSAEEQAAAQEEKKRSGSSLGGFGASSVAAILERRKFLMADASSDSDSDHDDGDWA